MIPTFDFETYSEAGFLWDPSVERWRGVTKGKRGLPAVGAAAYAQHPTTEVLCLAYDLGSGPQLWIPGGMTDTVRNVLIRGTHLWLWDCIIPDAQPTALFEYLGNGGLLEAHNSMFEYLIWLYVCHGRMGWPELPLDQLRCSMSKMSAYNLPPSLGAAAKALKADAQKGLGR